MVCLLQFTSLSNMVQLKSRNVELETHLEESQEVLQSIRGEYSAFKHDQTAEQTFLQGQVERLQHELKKQYPSHVIYLKCLTH